MAWRLSGMGLEFVSAVAGMAVVGWLIDRWAGTTPRWTIVGVVLGLVGGGYNFMAQAVRAGRAADRAYRQAHPGSGAAPTGRRSAGADSPRERDDE